MRYVKDTTGRFSQRPHYQPAELDKSAEKNDEFKNYYKNVVYLSDKAVGLISMQYIKDPTDPKWANDPAMKEYFAFMKKYLPDLEPMDANATYGMAAAQLTVQVIKQCGDNLTRDNVMKQAANLKNFQVPMALPGVLANTGANDYAPFQTMQLVKFDGKTWIGAGEPVAVR